MLTGSGRATKRQIQLAICREFALPQPPDPPDVADAMAIALCHISMEKQRGEAPLITRIRRYTGRRPGRRGDLATGVFDYQVLIPDFVRRQLQSQVGREVSLHTIHYLEGNPAHGRLTPRLVGFLSEVEREFFEMFCSRRRRGSAQGAAGHGASGPRRGRPDCRPGCQGPGGLARHRPGHVRADHRQAAAQNVQIRPDCARARNVHANRSSTTWSRTPTCCSPNWGTRNPNARRLLDETLATKKRFKDVDALLHAVYETAVERRSRER